MSGDRKIRVGSRKSELALIQTRHVIALLKRIHPEKEFEIVSMSTLGDNVLDIPLPKIGEKALFTKELESALENGSVDFVVHSLKDLPTTLPPGMAIGAVLAREDPRDALVLHKDYKEMSLETLPEGSTIGTSSLRRTAQLAKKHPKLKVESIRGNLNTRLRKLDELGQFQAIILAAAGLNRMGWDHRISKILESDHLLYAVGQGALAVECRSADAQTILLLRSLYDPETALRVVTERSFLRTLGGGCSAPVAVVTDLSTTKEDKLKIAVTGAVWSLDGTQELKDNDEGLVQIIDNKRCSVCPFNYRRVQENVVEENGNKSSCTKNNCQQTDIECLKQCSFKESGDGLIPNKKQKLDNSAEASTSVLLNVLDRDPHDHCPVDIPVGLDFMGKCPYLDSTLVKINTKKCPMLSKLKDLKTADLTKCPFLSDVSTGSEGNTVQGGSSQNSNNTAVNVDNDSSLYVGLVPHADIPEWAMKEAQGLGERLAQRLMIHGAVEIMAKAQAHIRGS